MYNFKTNIDITECFTFTIEKSIISMDEGWDLNP